MSEATSVVRAYFEQMWNKHDLDAFDEYVSPAVRYHPPRGPAKGYDGYREMTAAFFEGIPDLHFDIDELLEARGLVALRIRITGTHRGVWHGVPPTGRPIDVQGRPWLRVEGGRVVEVWSLFDELGAMRQIGAIP